MPTATVPGKPSPFTNAGRRFPPEVLTDAEARALMDACGEGLPSCARNRALIALLYRGGLRVSEALALYPKDLDAASGPSASPTASGPSEEIVSIFGMAWAGNKRCSARRGAP